MKDKNLNENVLRGSEDLNFNSFWEPAIFVDLQSIDLYLDDDLRFPEVHINSVK